jgi:hypothetical protein
MLTQYGRNYYYQEDVHATKGWVEINELYCKACETCVTIAHANARD